MKLYILQGSSEKRLTGNREKIYTSQAEPGAANSRAAVINRGMIRPMLLHYYSAEAESVEFCIIWYLPRLR